MARRMSFAVDEWYHCYNRGVDKRDIFSNEHDANRFLMLLYLANSDRSVDLYNERRPQVEHIIGSDRGLPLVSVGAYCLMTNHYHLLLKETSAGGITAFMRKLGTAYTMYFNAKYERVGHLFAGPFRARHVGTDRYFQRVIQYIHCNPAELYEKGWKRGEVGNIAKLEEKLLAYAYSSFLPFTNKNIRSGVLGSDVFDIAHELPPRKMLEEARAYYADLSGERFER